MADVTRTKIFGLSNVHLLLLILTVVGILLIFTTIPGVFIIDEDNYLVSLLALKQWRFDAPGTENLTRSRELAYFDPEAQRRDISSTALIPLVAPFYAVIALPFSVIGWKGLFLLNILAFLGTTLLVFLYVQKFAQDKITPWFASSVFLLGGYCIEYAQGVWPHMLSAALCTYSFFLAAKAREKESWVSSLLAGLVIGFATGIREQNIFLAGCIGLGLFFWTQHRFGISISFGVGVLTPLAALALINLYKIGMFHPFPKVYAYMSDVSSTQATFSPLEPLKVLWAKVVDFSFSGPIDDPVKAALFHRAPGSGAVLVYGFVKKALLQSAPWTGLALAGLVTQWFTGQTAGQRKQREFRAISLVVIPTLVMFSLAGFSRTDALSFNQRYFIELLPLCAIAVALLTDSSEPKFSYIAVGGLMGSLLVLVVLNLPSAYLKYSGQLRLPLILSAALILIWALPFLRARREVLSLLLGAAIGWSLLIHFQTDLVGSRSRRLDNYHRLQILANVLPDHSALLAYWGNKDAAGPLQLERDIVILDIWADNGEDAPRLVDELLTQDRRVFLLTMDVPEEMLRRIVSTRPKRELSESFMNFIEILKHSPRSP